MVITDPDSHNERFVPLKVAITLPGNSLFLYRKRVECCLVSLYHLPVE